MRKAWAFMLLAVVGAVLAPSSSVVSPGLANASSHREAPLISEDPTADNTDLYAFRSPDKPNTLTIVSQLDPGRGSRRRAELLHVLARRAKYHIYVDRNGDGKPDITYNFRFKTPTGPYFLGNTQQTWTATRNGKRVRDRQDADQQHRPALQRLRRRQGLRGRRREDDRHARTASRSSPASVTIRSSRDVGAIFDLVAIRKAGTTGNKGGGKDFLSGYNVHTIALQIPISQVDTQSRTRSASGRRPTARTSPSTASSTAAGRRSPASATR